LGYQVSYTWGHMTDDASSSYDNGQNMGWLKGEYADSDFDRRHNFVTTFIYELPVGQGHRLGSGWSPVLNAVLGRWQVNGIVSYRTGLPFTVRPGRDVRGDGSVTTQRVDAVLGVSPYASRPGPQGYLNKAAFAFPETGHYGDLGRNALRASNFRTVDFSIFKNIPTAWFAGEKATLQFRAEVFNAFNHPNFGIPESNLSSPNFGKIFATVAQSTTPSQAGSTMRQIQLALKLIF
jgi:hypothetical protein